MKLFPSFFINRTVFCWQFGVFIAFFINTFLAKSSSTI